MIPIGIIGGFQGFQSTSLMLIGLIAFVTLVFSLIMSYFITRPLEKITKNIDEISKGKLDVKLENSEIFEINKLTNSLNRVMTSLKLAIHKVGVKKGEIFEEAVKAKETAEKRYENLLNNISGWAWEIDDKGIYTYCSKNISDLLEYKTNEIIGKSIFYFMLEDEKKKTKYVFNSAVRKKQPIKQLENWNISKSGKRICVIANAVPFFDDNGNLQGYRGVDVDITPLKQSENKLYGLNLEVEELNKKIDGLIKENERLDNNKPNKFFNFKDKLEDKWTEHEFDSVFIFDNNANILDCNDNMFKQLGYSKSELLSMNMVDFDALESKDDILNKIDTVKKNGYIDFKTIHRRKDGSAVLVNQHIKYLKDQDKFKCIVRIDPSTK